MIDTDTDSNWMTAKKVRFFVILTLGVCFVFGFKKNFPWIYFYFIQNGVKDTGLHLK